MTWTSFSTDLTIAESGSQPSLLPHSVDDLVQTGTRLAALPMMLADETIRAHPNQPSSPDPQHTLLLLVRCYQRTAGRSLGRGSTPVGGPGGGPTR
eukprot:3936007-Rhodomonas_salina.2